MSYSREEQETTMVFCNESKKWIVYSSVPKHIRKLKEITGVFEEIIEDGRIISLKCELTQKQVSMRKERVVSEEQRQKAAERLAKARQSN